MRGTAEPQSMLWATDALCGDLIDDEGFLATLGRAMGTVFCDADFDPLYPSGRGRPSHPPSVLAALLLAQVCMVSLIGRPSDAPGWTCRGRRRWVCPLDHRGIPHVCLAEFRARLLKAGIQGFLHDQLLKIAAQAGVLGRRRVVDSTGISDSVMTQDTVTLIRQALRRCVALLAKIDPGKAARLESALLRDDYHREGKPQILWSDPSARTRLLGAVC